MKMNERLTTRDLAEILARETGLDNARCEKFIEALSAYITEHIETHKSVKIIGLGVFKVALVKERESVHIQTGERFVIPAHHKLSFVPDKDLKEHINRPFAFLEPVETTYSNIAEKKAAQKEKTDNQKFTVTAPVQENIEKSSTAEPNTTTTADAITAASLVSDPVIQESASSQYQYTESASGINETEKKENTRVLEAPIRKTSPKAQYHKVTYRHKKQKRIPLWWWGLLLPLFIIIGIGAGTYVFLHYNKNATVMPFRQEQKWAALDTQEVNVQESGDTIFFSENDSLPEINEAEALPPSTKREDTTEQKEEKAVVDWLATSDSEETKAQTEKKQEPKKSEPKKAKEKIIPASVLMNAGSSLTQIALEHYGDKVFWVYIYEYNKNEIGHFDNIPVGTKLRLPPPQKYGINAKSKKSVQEARQKQSDLLKWDNWDDYHQ